MHQMIDHISTTEEHGDTNQHRNKKRHDGFLSFSNRQYNAAMKCAFPPYNLQIFDGVPSWYIEGLSAARLNTKLYSITSSARADSGGGTSMPSAFAVLRLITNSNLVTCTRSAGLSPLRTRPA